MKKALFVVLLVLLFITGCNSNKYIVKSSYNVNEEAMIDDIVLKLTDVKYHNNKLEVVFDIKNNTKNTYTIGEDSFKMYDINQVLVSNEYHNENNIIKKGQTISHTLIYEVPKKEIYEIYFYSGFVNNNIKFVITSTDLN